MDEQSLSHTKWKCQYHIVIVPKYRRKAIYGKLRQDIGVILRKLCEYKQVEIIEAHAMPDHIHMLLSIPPKLSVGDFMGYLKGKSTLMIFERHANMKYKYVMADALNPAMTAGVQWFERTLDDSANRRISIPEAFLATDGILTLYLNVISGLTVYPKVIEKHLMEELPFMATENILMYCVKHGGDRQTLHEAIRRHSVAVGKAIKQDGADNDLLDRIAADPAFGIDRKTVDEIIRTSNFTGIAAEQVRDYLTEVREMLADNAEVLAGKAESQVNV